MLLEKADSQRLRQSNPRVNKGKFWEAAARALPRLADQYPSSLPQNSRRLQMKFNQYLKGGYITLISARFNNTNAAKVDDDIKDSVLQTLVGDPRNLDNEMIAKLYNIIAERMNWKMITAGAVAARSEKYDLTTYARRVGETNFRNTKTMQFKRSRPTAAMLMWTLDGWDAELYYQKRGSNGVTTYCNRKTLELVLDPCTNYPIGYSIGDQEDSALIIAALRDAANHTKELFGSRYRTYQLQSDNYAIKAMMPYYSVVAEKITPARVKNSKAKVIEPYFKKFNDTYCKPWPNWSGYGVTSRKESQPNSEWLNKQRHNFPDEEQVIRQLEFAIEAERTRLHDEYMKMWEAMPKERRLPLPYEQFLLKFGAETGYTNVLQGSGLHPRIEGVKRQYDCFDHNFRDHSNLKWTIKYDVTDLSHVLAISEDGQYRYMLEEKYVQPMALAERKEGDGAQISRVNDFNRRLEQQITERLSVTGAKVDQLFLENPQLENTLAKSIICDSLGQHKNRRNEERHRLERGTSPEQYETVTDAVCISY